MPDEPMTAAKNEAAKQTVILVFTVAGLVISYFGYMKIGKDFQEAQRNAGDPDFSRSQRMRQAKVAERVFARLAGWSWRMAERARVAYERDRA